MTFLTSNQNSPLFVTFANNYPTRIWYDICCRQEAESRTLTEHYYYQRFMSRDLVARLSLTHVF